MGIFLNAFFRRRRWPKRYFISIGAGKHQLPLIIEAKKLGLKVIGIDINSNAPGFPYCDLKIQESVNDYMEIADKLDQLMINGVVSGVLTKSYGSAVKTAAYIAERFNIPYIPFKRCDDFISKKKMKHVFAANQIPTPHQINPFAAKPAKSKIMFPVIAKPVSGHAKTDVMVFKNQKELKSKFSKKNSEDIIFEEYTEGDEIIAVGLIYNGKFQLVDITDKVTSEKPFFVDIMHISPSKYFDRFDEIEAIGEKIASAFEIKTSPLVMEIIMNENGPVVIEAVPEFGGEFIADIILPQRSGYNIVRETVRAMTEGVFKKISGKKASDSVVIRYVTAEKKGILKSIDTDTPGKSSGVIFSDALKKIGEELRPPENNHDRIAVLAMKARTADAAKSMAASAAEKFNIIIE